MFFISMLDEIRLACGGDRGVPSLMFYARAIATIRSEPL